jgi:hypothetical protein
MPDLGQMDWVLVGGAIVVLVVAWTILKTVLKLTMRVFSLGCVGLVILAGIMGALVYFAN